MSELLTVEDIARIWRCSVRLARDVLVKSDGFPPPAPGSGPKHRVWVAQEISDFAYRRTRQNPANDPQSRASA